MVENELTQLLQDWHNGSRPAFDRLTEVVYPVLKEKCSHLMFHEHPGHTLQPTALLNEVFIRLMKKQDINWANRWQFFAFASRFMREILVDHARKVRAHKRWGGQIQVKLEDVNLTVPAHDILVIDINNLLEKLEPRDPRMVQIIDLYVFGGLQQREIADFLGVSRVTVQREWKVAKRYLGSIVT